MAGASPDVTHKEGKTIVQVASLFNQLLQHFPRTEFAAIVKKHRAEHAAKGFTCWTQFVSMLFVAASMSSVAGPGDAGTKSVHQHGTCLLNY